MTLHREAISTALTQAFAAISLVSQHSGMAMAMWRNVATECTARVVAYLAAAQSMAAIIDRFIRIKERIIYMLLEARCKTGKLQVSEEGFIRVQKPFNKTDWQISCSTVTKFITQPIGLGLTVLIHTSQGVFTIETFTKQNFEKLRSLFPAAQVQNHDRAVYWYQDVTKRAHATTYTNQKAMQREVEKAAQYGWMPQTSAGIGGHINVGRTATAAALTGGVSLLFGASRSKDKMTITYVRTPEWLAQN
jgi:hypothetical protein